MEVVIVIALTFALCFAVDKGFHKIFRRRPQHRSGKAVRLTKKYMLAGLLILFFAVILAVTAIGAGDKAGRLLVLAGLLAVMGGGLVAYFVSFGVFYDEETFLCSAFGKKTRTYRFSQIKEQQLLRTQGGICVELFLDDGKDIGIYANMDGAYDFLDAACRAWHRARGLDPERCGWYDPQNSCWFPPHDPEAAEKAQNAADYEMKAEDSPRGESFSVERGDKEDS